MTIEAKMQREVWNRLPQGLWLRGLYTEVHEGIDVSVDWQTSGRLWEEINS